MFDKDTEYHLRLVARDVHVTPKSEEVQILPPLISAVWYCPLLLILTESQFALANGAYLSVSTFTPVPNNDPLVCERNHVFPS